MKKNTQLEKLFAQWQAMQPLSQRSLERLNRRFSIAFNYNSNHIEGNTLTYGQTELLLLFGRVVGTAEMKDLEDMKASSVGVRMMTIQAEEKDSRLTEIFIRQLHQTLLREDYDVYRNLPGGVTTSYTVHAGQYKTRPNSVITRYGDRFDYAMPEETPFMMRDLVDWYNTMEETGELTPVQLAALFHYRYIRIHPFEDGNGRIARLMVNYILVRHGYPMIVVRSRKKNEYLEALHRADLKVGSAPFDGANAKLDDIKPFLTYFEQLVCDEIDSAIKYITESEDNIWWHEGEYLVLRNENTIKLLRLLQDNPRLSIREMAEEIGINKSAVQRQLKRMTDLGYVIAPQPGDAQWHVIVESSK